AHDGRRAASRVRGGLHPLRTPAGAPRNGGAGRSPSDPAGGHRFAFRRGRLRVRGWDKATGDHRRRRCRQGRPGGRDGSSGALAVNTAMDDGRGERPGEQTLSLRAITDDPPPVMDEPEADPEPEQPEPEAGSVEEAASEPDSEQEEPEAEAASAEPEAEAGVS